MALQDKVTVIVDRYIANYNQFEEQTTKILDEAVVKMAEIKEEALIRQVDEQVASFNENYHAQAQNQNNLLQVVLEEEKDNLFPKVDKSADYAAKIANAIEFIKLEGADITDDVAYSILKDFTHDYDQMKLFKRMIEKNVDLTGVTGTTRFPKTFGIYNQMEYIHSTYETLESFAQTIFLEPLESHNTKRVYSNYYKVPSRGYKQQLAEKKVIELAAHIDEAVKNIQVA